MTLWTLRVRGVTVLAASVVAGECRGRPSASAFTESGDKVFCGDPLEQGYQKCVDQMELFALASLIPAVLALVLMVAAFTTPVLRTRPALRAQTLGYSLVAWMIAGGTVLMGWLPAI